MADSKQIAAGVVEAVGGAGNITVATHCITRLRLNLKDQSIVNDDEVKAVKGVLGVQRVGQQYQVIIGQKVTEVYEELIAITGLEEQKPVDENLDAGATEEKLTAKKVGSNILDYISSSMVPILPAIMSAGLFKTIQVILGPSMLGIITETSSLYLFINIVFNAAMYFIPMYLAYSAAKKLCTSRILAAFLAGILLEPNFVAMVDAGSALDFLGLPIRLVSYGQSVVPILLTVWVMSYVYKFFQKHVPELLSFLFVPFLTMLVMAPLELVVLAPIGAYLGDLVAGGLMALANVGGVVTVLATTVLCAFQPFLVIAGMHQALAPFGINAVAENGFDPFILVCNNLSNFAVWGATLAAAIRFKNADEKGNAVGAFVSGILGGVTEPGLFGVILEHKRLFAAMTIGGAAAGFTAGILHVYLYTVGASSIMSLLNFVTADNPMNVVNAAIAGAVGFGVALVIGLLFGLTPEEAEGKDVVAVG